MSMDSVRRAFQAMAGDALRLDQAGLLYEGSRQKLTFTGFHADGTPFALVTGPFDTDPVARAINAARDIIAAHNGAPARTAPPVSAPISALRSTVQMSQKGSGLARLVGGLSSLDSAADALASRLEAAMGSLQSEMATTTAIVGNVEKSVSDLRSVNALYSNGGPALPTSGGSAPNSGS